MMILVPRIGALMNPGDPTTEQNRTEQKIQQSKKERREGGGEQDEKEKEPSL